MFKDLSNERYVAANFTGCGKTNKAFQHIAAEMVGQANDIEEIQANIIDVEKKLINQDKDTCKHLKRTNSIYCFTQSNDITSKGVYVVLLDEGGVRLYNEVCVKAILYFVATGSVITPVEGFPQIYPYSMTTPDPFGLPPPVSLVDAILLSHNAFRITKSFHILREKGKEILKQNRTPKAIIVDFSRAMISAVLRELNSMSKDRYG